MLGSSWFTLSELLCMSTCVRKLKFGTYVNFLNTRQFWSFEPFGGSDEATVVSSYLGLCRYRAFKQHLHLLSRVPFGPILFTLKPWLLALPFMCFPLALDGKGFWWCKSAFKKQKELTHFPAAVKCNLYTGTEVGEDTKTRYMLWFHTAKEQPCPSRRQLLMTRS